MRLFSKFEQDLITKIVDIDPQNANVSTFISDSILKDRGVKIDETNGSIDLWFQRSDNDAVSQFFETIALIKYLERSDLIFIHSNPDQPLNNGDFLSKNIDQAYLDNHIANLIALPIPTDIYDLMRRFIRSYIFTGTELKELVKNKFKSTEQLQFESEIKIARISLVIAFVALIFSFISPLLFDNSNENNQLNKLYELIKMNQKIDMNEETIKSGIQTTKHIKF
jgi:hypothetical protein